MKIVWLNLLATVLLTAGLKVGEKFPELHLKDQFDKPQTITKQDKWVVMVFEKSVSVALSHYFKSKDASFVQKHHIRFISDISTMPSFITKMFALPKMRKYPFPVLLIRDESGKMFERKPKHITVFKLRRRVITEKRFVKPEELESVLLR